MAFHNEIYDVLNKLEGRKFTLNIMKNYKCKENGLNLTCDEAKLFKYFLKMIMKKHKKKDYIEEIEEKSYLKKDIVQKYLTDFGKKFNDFRKNFYDIMKKENAQSQSISLVGSTTNSPIV